MPSIPVSRRAAVLLIVLATACAGSTTTDEPELQEPDAERSAVPADARIEMSRDACLGPCPVYRVVLTADGKVRWRGELHVATLGDATSTISRAAFAELWNALLRAPFADLPGTHAIHHPTCPHGWSDASTTIVALTGRGVNERVVDYRLAVCESLEAFRALEARIDEVAGTHRWIGTPARR